MLLATETRGALFPLERLTNPPPTRREAAPTASDESVVDRRLLQRAERLEARTIEYVGAAGGEAVDACSPPGRESECPDFLAELTEETWLEADREAELFRRMNQMKRRADELRRSLDRCRPQAPLMSRIEALLDAAQRIRDRLVSVYLKLAVSVAKSFLTPERSLDELVSEASVTLLRAIEKFNVDFGFRFSTYATHAMRRGIWRYLNRTRSDRSHWAPLPELHAVVDQRVWTADRERRFARVLNRLDGMIDQLSDRDRSIVLSRYGLGDELQPQTLQQLADRFGVSRERIRQLEFRALHKLRTMAKNDRELTLEA